MLVSMPFVILKGLEKLVDDGAHADADVAGRPLPVVGNKIVFVLEGFVRLNAAGPSTASKRS